MTNDLKIFEQNLDNGEFWGPQAFHCNKLNPRQKPEWK